MIFRKVLTRGEYPGLDPEAVGTHANVGYGTVKNLGVPCIEGGAVSALTAAVDSTQTSIAVVDAGCFPAAPFTVQVGYELMRVSAVADNALSVTRGYDDTEPAAHGVDMAVYEVRLEYVYLVSPEPVKSIDAIYRDGIRQSGGYNAYTGQSGDEHLSWPGQAVVSVLCEGIIAQQRNLAGAEATQRERGEIIAPAVEYVSHPAVTDASQSSYAELSPEGTPCVRVSHKSVGGVLKSQTYMVEVQNPAAQEGSLWAVVTDAATGETLAGQPVYVSAQQSGTFVLTHEGGGARTVLTLVAQMSVLRVISVTKEVVRYRLPDYDDMSVSYEPSVVSASDRRVHDGQQTYADVSPEGRLSAWVAYGEGGPGDATGQGGAGTIITRQCHRAEVENASATSEAVVRLISVGMDALGQSGAGYALTEHVLGPGATEMFEHGHAGGGWDVMTVLQARTGTVHVRSLSKEVSYTTAAQLRDRADHASVSAVVVIGERVSVDASLTYDHSGQYGGVGELVQRPDLVLSHLLCERLGIGVQELDAAAFAAAGAAYAAAVSGGYRLSFIIGSDRLPSELLRDLARQSRSTLSCERGKWVLQFQPDAAPVPVKTVTAGELAGEGAQFVFDGMAMGELGNRLLVRYGLALGDEEAWAGVLEGEHTGSVAKYGAYERAVELPAVWDAAMAQDVMEHMLREYAEPLLRVRFTVFYEHFDLSVGDTVEVENELYGGERFFIESIRRVDRFRSEITALQWYP